MRNKRINRKVNKLLTKVNKGITLSDKNHAFMLKNSVIYELFLKMMQEDYEEWEKEAEESWIKEVNNEEIFSNNEK